MKRDIGQSCQQPVTRHRRHRLAFRRMIHAAGRGDGAAVSKLPFRVTSRLSTSYLEQNFAFVREIGRK